MKKALFLASLVLMMSYGQLSIGGEWVAANPIFQKIEYVTYYYLVPTPVVVPIITQYVPVVTYENVMVQSGGCCFSKQYHMVTVPKVVYVPVNQIIKY
jgi:hypothetical protein